MVIQRFIPIVYTKGHVKVYITRVRRMNNDLHIFGNGNPKHEILENETSDIISKRKKKPSVESEKWNSNSIFKLIYLAALNG